MTHRQRGLTMIELLISVVLSLVMTLVLVQLHVQSTLLSDRQQIMDVRLENAAMLVHLLSHNVRDALFRVDQVLSSQAPGEGGLPVSDSACAGISIYAQCLPPVISWSAPGNGAQLIASALPGTDVLQIKQTCCEDVIADQFYLAYRGGVPSNPVSLYRRRMRTDGSFRPAVELVEGVSSLTVRFIVDNDTEGQLALVDNKQVDNWWQLSAVRVRALLNNAVSTDLAGLSDALPVSFTVAARQWHQTAVGPNANPSPSPEPPGTTDDTAR